jgi:integrase
VPVSVIWRNIVATLIKRRRANGSLAYRVQDRTTGYPSLSETFSTLKAAREFRRKIERERSEGLAGIYRGRQRLVEAVAVFTETAEFRKRKAARDTLRQLKWWANRLGQLPLARITPELVADHLHTLEADGCSGSTVNRYRSALSRLFRYAIKTRHWTDHNPCAMVERRQEGKARERVITPDEWRALVKTAEKERAAIRENNRMDAVYSPRAQLASFLRVAYGTAARSGDVRDLLWEYVDLGERLVTFHDPKNGTGYTVPLVGDALKAIRAQGRLKREGCPWVFPSPLTDDHPTKFDNAFARIRKAARLDGFDAKGERLVIHSLRHSAATEAGKGGATAFEVAAMTNHRTLAMVQRYTKTDETHALAAMRKRKRA